MRLPSKECTFVTRGEVIWGDDSPPLVKDFFPVEGEVLDDDERGRASLVLFFRHQSRNLARWELEPMHRGSDLERKALESNLCEYLHFAERLPENRLQDRR